MLKKFREMRKSEEGFTLVEMLFVMVALSILMIAVANPALTGTKALARMQAVDTTVNPSPVAVELRNVHQQATRCVAEYVAPTRSSSPAGYLKFTSIVKSDIQTCLDVVNVPATLKYEAKRMADGNICVVGYDVVRDTDKFSEQDPYIFYSPQGIIYKDSFTPCGYSPKKGDVFNWEGMK